jgi:hypothetical protein
LTTRLTPNSIKYITEVKIRFRIDRKVETSRVATMKAAPLEESWENVSDEQSAAFLHEITAEMSSEHALYGIGLKAIGCSRSVDDVLFQLEDGRVADVHLTWSQKAERLPWPRYRIYANLAEWMEQVMFFSRQDE